jgi:4-hydroxy-3-polyprenylbenzoate decarboxylase
VIAGTGGGFQQRDRPGRRRLMVGISGASGVVYGVRLLEVLRDVPDVETHLVMTAGAKQTLTLETDWKPQQVEALADVVYRFNDLAAAPSSGSYRMHGMVVAPCSMRSLSAIAHSANDNLLVRAADVMLKERRRLVLLPRETPLHLGHLRLLVQVTEMGAIVAPPVPAFYQRPASLAEVIDHTVLRVLDLFDIEPATTVLRRWTGARRDLPSDAIRPLLDGNRERVRR